MTKNLLRRLSTKTEIAGTDDRVEYGLVKPDFIGPSGLLTKPRTKIK